MKRQLCTNQGFTLLEVLVAMVILSVGAMGLASLQIGMIKANAYAKRRTVATNVAQTQVERVRQGQACVPTQNSLNPYYAVSCATVAGPNGTQDVTVTVSWSDPTQQYVRLKIRI
jgi:type IV pilus assembly protein PilV